MKKIIGIIGIVAVATALFISTSINVEAANLNLASLASLNYVNPEEGNCQVTDPWGPYPGFRPASGSVCVDHSGQWCGVEVNCVPADPSYTCTASSCPTNV